MLYVFRRRLQMGVDEVRALPWWQKRMYLEGLFAEARAMDPNAEDDVEVDSDLDSLAGMGFAVGSAG